MISVAVNANNTHGIPVDRGVLQGDPSSPLLFNLCFNPLMRTLSQSKFKHLGYMWGPKVDPYSSSWLQFADDTAIIANDVKSAQTLINLNVAWCKWAGVHVRIDKCVSFGMRKQEGEYKQYLPNLTIDDSTIPAHEIGSSFKYLGKLFNFEMDNNEEQAILVKRLSTFLRTISKLNIKVQLKLKIFRNFIPSQFNFDLRVYDLSYTWIEQHLDSLTVNAVNDWLELPNGSCTAEFLQLPAKQGGYGIPSMKMTAQKLRLGIRFMLKHNREDELRKIGQSTSTKNIPLDSIINSQQSKSSAMTSLETQHLDAAVQHVSSLKIQGKSFNSIRETFDEKTIYAWSTMVDNLLPRHALLIHQEGISTTTADGLELVQVEEDGFKQIFNYGGSVQTNKHTLNNCGSTAALARYKSRHNHVLSILAQWISSAVKEESVVFVDLNEPAYKPLSELFISLRPDIAIKCQNRISTLELTICHETNMKASKRFKSSKYNNLNQNLLPEFSRCKLLSNTVEISSLGFISDISDFSK